MNKSLFSTGRDEWETPPEFFAALNSEFNFMLDACASPDTAKCPRYFTPEDDGLKRPWTVAGGVRFSVTRRILGGQRTSPDKRTGSKRRRRRAHGRGPWSLCSSRRERTPPLFTIIFITGRKSDLFEAASVSWRMENSGRPPRFRAWS